MLIKNGDGSILEAGCGNGRILRYYHNQGCDIILNNSNNSRIEPQNKSIPIFWRRDELPYINMTFNETPNTNNYNHSFSKIKKRIFVDEVVHGQSFRTSQSGWAFICSGD